MFPLGVMVVLVLVYDEALGIIILITVFHYMGLDSLVAVEA